MTIAAELDRIISAKNDILSAINDKGVSTAGTTSISQCPALINAIQTGGGGNTPSSMHSTAATVYQWKGSAEFYHRMTQIPGLSFDNPSITASATSWSTSRSGALGDSGIGWKVAAFDTGILSCAGVFMSSKGIGNFIRPFAANYKPSGSANPTGIGTTFVWLDAEENHGTLESATNFSRIYSLSAANVLSTSQPVYVGWQYGGGRSYIGRASGSMSASGGDTATSLPYPDQPGVVYKTSTVSAEYSSVFTSGSAESRPGGEYSYLMQGRGSGYVSSFLGNKRFIYANTTVTSVKGSASAVSEARPGGAADQLYNCIKNHTGYTASSMVDLTANFISGDLFSRVYTSTYPETAWQSAITGSAWLGQSTTGHLF